MPLLRKTGIRSPWLPSPFGAGVAPPTDALRPVIVIGAIVPALLLGGITQPVGIPAREPNLDPRRATTIQVGQVPVPGASTWMPTPARLPNTDPLRPTTLLAGQQPIPGASVWKPEPARLPNTDPLRPIAQQAGQVPIPGAAIWAPTPIRTPNTDPLRPLTSIQEAPDASLVQPFTDWIGRLPRDEDTTRPARSAVVAVGAVPVPGALLVQTRAGREAAASPPEERLAFTSVLVAQPPVPGAAVVPVGRITATPTERLAPARVLAGQMPQPGASALLLRVPRDEVVVADRLSPTLVISGKGLAPPGASATWLNQPKVVFDRLSPTIVIGAVLAPPGDSAWRPIRPGVEGERVPSTGMMVVSVLLARPPDARVSFLRVLRDFGEIFASVFLDARVSGPAGGTVRSAAPGSRAHGGGQGDVESPGSSGKVEGE